MARILFVIVKLQLLVCAIATKDGLLSVLNKNTHTGSSQIVNGDKVRASEMQVKYQVLLSGITECGGAVIAEQYILTAAHCVVDSKNNNFIPGSPTVLAGLTNFRTVQVKSFVFEVQKAYVPQSFGWRPNNTTTIGDIAVLKLKDEIYIGSDSLMDKVDLPPANMIKSYDGAEALVSGFGVDSVTYKPDVENKTAVKMLTSTSGHLNKMQVRILSDDEADRFSDYCKPRENYICAVIDSQYERGGVCHGDSGGPLVSNNTIIGIVIGAAAMVYQCHQLQVPALYTRVSTYVDFIRNAMKDIVTPGMRVHTW